MLRLVRVLQGLETYEEKQEALINALHTYCSGFRDTLNGTADLDDIGENELRGGAQIQEIFLDFVKELDEIKILEVVDPSGFRTAVQNCIGVGTGLFTPTETFELIIRRGVKECLAPALNCVEEVRRDTWCGSERGPTCRVWGRPHRPGRRSLLPVSPHHRSIGQVHDELMRIVNTVQNRELMRYPRLRSKASAVVHAQELAQPPCP